jgi:hypothetical protein
VVGENVRNLTTWKLLAVLLVGAIVGFAVLFADAPTWNHQQRHVASSGPVAFWATLMCVQTALWALVLVWLFPTIRRFPRDYFRESRSEIIGSTILILAILIALAVTGIVSPRWPNYFPGHAAKLGALTILGGLVGLVAAWGIWLVHGGLKVLAGRDLKSEESLKTFLSLQDELSRFLGVLGAIIGLLVLSTGAHRRAVLSYAPTTRYGFELVLAYGFLFTILVAAVYLPAHLTRTRVASEIRDAVFPSVPPSAHDWIERTNRRKKLGNTLGLEQGPLAQFKTSVAILTPLLGSLTGLLLNAG